ncbi:hypothetical protein [Lentiprolixibacter aurantiacus]|uniref:Uncharacterized protein n=1 Tax=Lentiprolixibacter aurantiacus TaxID=2993939 RepID=A0AAE3MJF8_9FLAO|nr:hypothetical protein [Lentiprolixibacter aurantiacus]MCX2718900.1 hypothetical protein [Lentiprolixibacter aurantiacus]
MNSRKKRIKSIAVLLLALILLQSCASYEAPLSVKQKQIDNPRGFD